VDQQLVRFVGMIQDIENPELFLEKYEVRDNISGQKTVKMVNYWDIPACRVSVLCRSIHLFIHSFSQIVYDADFKLMVIAYGGEISKCAA
jgi:hypothetical protein